MTASRNITTKPDWFQNSGSTQTNFNDDLERDLNKWVLGFGPVLPAVAVADLPTVGTAGVEIGMQVFVTDAVPSAVPAYNDGAVWRSFITGLVIV